MLENHWLNIRKKLLSQVKNQVFIRTGQLSPGLKSYAKTYENEFLRGSWQVCQFASLMTSIASARLVLGAEFHPYAQSQRTHLRVLRGVPDDRLVILALECFEAEHQKLIDQYLKDEITEEVFLQAISWNDRWGFEWANYKPIVELAKGRGFKVIGLNKYYKTRSSRTLGLRDRFSASQVDQAIKNNTDSLVYVIYGEWHLATKHLPAEIYKFNKNYQKQTVVIYQNSEKLYFNLARDHKEHIVQVLKGNKNRYCLINSPPWIQWQTYLMYLDQNETAVDVDWEEDEIDFTDYVYNSLQFICKDLKIKKKFDDFSVYSSEQIDEIKSFESKLSKNLLKYIEHCVRSDRSFYIAEENFNYLSRASVNQMASLAGYYLAHKLSGATRTPVNMPDDFLKLIWMECWSFFNSKIINHKRKSENIEELKLQFAAQKLQKYEKSVLLLSLEHRINEILYLQGHEFEKARYKAKSIESYFESARILGNMMGEKMYFAYRTNKISMTEVKKLLSYNVNSSGFEALYFKTIERIGDQSIPFTAEGVVYE